MGEWVGGRTVSHHSINALDDSKGVVDFSPGEETIGGDWESDGAALIQHLAPFGPISFVRCPVVSGWVGGWVGGWKRRRRLE